MSLGTNAIPKAREDLLRIAQELDSLSMELNLSRPMALAMEIIDIVNSMHRRKPLKHATIGKRTPVPPLDPALRKQVFDMAKVGYKNRVIARTLGLGDGGRVSEILHGDR